MARPPIKAFKAVRNYCKKKKECDGCPLYVGKNCTYHYCRYIPQDWDIEEVGDEK